jgi:hypothetical protein
MIGSRKATEMSSAQETAISRYKKKASEESRMELVAKMMACVDSLSCPSSEFRQLCCTNCTRVEFVLILSGSAASRYTLCEILITDSQMLNCNFDWLTV